MMSLSVIPLESALLLCFLLGSLIASFLNLAIYRLAWHPRAISPWSRLPKNLLSESVTPRTLLDRIPIVGWLRLRRESHIWGTIFWIRPMLIELFFGLGLATLYWHEVDRSGFFSSSFLVSIGPEAPWWTLLNGNLKFEIFCGHTLLISLMVVATWIDIDEKIIPDEITLPGTVLGILFVTLNPWLLPPDTTRQLLIGDRLYVDFMHLAAPLPWSDGFAGGGAWGPLLLALGCLWLWCFALLPRCWYRRWGTRRALQYFVAHILRTRYSKVILVIAALGTLSTIVVWSCGGFHWAGLSTSLFGMAVGTVISWAVRLTGSAIMKKEAMGFGDVTLMAMIGAFVGWQATLIVFFIAPVAGLIVGLLQWISKRDNEIPYGPFLCLATVVLIIFWPQFWGYLGPIFATLGETIPILLLASLILMAVLLALLQWFKAACSRAG